MGLIEVLLRVVTGCGWSWKILKATSIYSPYQSMLLGLSIGKQTIEDVEPFIVFLLKLAGVKVLIQGRFFILNF